VCRAPLGAAIFAAMHSVHAQQIAEEAEAPSTGGLQEVIVTAQKRVENAQDVPITVTALDTKALEQLNVQNFNDYAQALPQLAYQTSAPGFSQIHMRGISSDNNPNHSGPLPTVGMYLDEQPITTIQGPLDLHVYDIARVEVLTGPQGTLYGASSEAGTVRLITNKPEIGKLKAGYDVQGNDQSHGSGRGIAEGFVNLPINDMMALRLVGWYEHDSGYIDNVRGTLTYPSSGFTLDNAASARNHYNDVDTSGGRAQLLIDIADTWTIMPQLMAQKSRWGGIFAQEDLGPVGLAAEGNAPIPDLAVRHFYPEGGDDYWTDAALTVQGKVANLDITYAGAFLKRDDHTPSDYSDYSLGYNAYASYWPPNSTQRILGMDHYQMWSNELRVATPKDLPLRAVVGAFAQRQTHDISQQYVITGLNPTYWVGYGTANPVPDTWWWTDEQRGMTTRSPGSTGSVSVPTFPAIAVPDKTTAPSSSPSAARRAITWSMRMAARRPVKETDGRRKSAWHGRSTRLAWSTSRTRRGSGPAASIASAPLHPTQRIFSRTTRSAGRRPGLTITCGSTAPCSWRTGTTFSSRSWVLTRSPSWRTHPVPGQTASRQSSNGPPRRVL
jgi:iron complex outermembrane receptor protein